MLTLRLLLLTMLLVPCGCRADESVSGFAALRPNAVYVYSLIDQQTGKKSVVHISANPSNDGLLVTETALLGNGAETTAQGSIAHPLGRVEYTLKTSDREIVQVSGSRSMTVLRAPARPGAPSWSNKREISGTAGTRDAEETCRVTSRGAEKVFAEELQVVTVGCALDVDGVKITTTYAYADSLGLVRRRVKTSSKSDGDLGTLAMSLTSIQAK
jgi:hypothetical protein